ncbi:hypothetical protein [Sodalis sp. dw_96]|uniref:hypothetical protein n=1 Tax=Sodalis sp. dw_96 TaxID=2719794 RepID=UPI001BD2E71F|nr:hypothetical protein [Sodalis sp. dw_96]
MAQRKLAKTRPVTKPHLSDPQQQFQAHWATIDRLQREMVIKQQRQEVVLARFRQEVLPVEHQYVQALYDKILRLISFADKKTLGKYNREALFSWIDEELDELFHHPFNEQLDLEALRQQFSALNEMPDDEPTPDEIDRFRQYVKEQYGSDGKLSDAELAEMMVDPEKMFTTLERLFPDAESIFDDDDDDDDDEDNDADHDHANDTDHDDDADDEKASGGGTDRTIDNAQHTLDGLLRSPEVKKMYKKLANILHPDREQDPEKKNEKHLLMVQLSKAKKNHDVWTILELYHRYSDPDFRFGQAEIPAINALMQRRIDTLTAELAETENPSSLSGMIWEKFGAKTTKAIDNKFRKHNEKLHQLLEQQVQEREQLRSLAALKIYLAPRRAALDFEWQRGDFF